MRRIQDIIGIDFNDQLPDSEEGWFFDRRAMIKLTAALAACVPASGLANDEKSTSNKTTDRQPELLPNSLVPAVQFQASPIGSAAYLERLVSSNDGNLPRREQITVEPWTGAIPPSHEEIAFLPAIVWRR